MFFGLNKNSQQKIFGPLLDIVVLSACVALKPQKSQRKSSHKNIYYLRNKLTKNTNFRLEQLLETAK